MPHGVCMSQAKWNVRGNEADEGQFVVGLRYRMALSTCRNHLLLPASNEPDNLAVSY